MGADIKKLRNRIKSVDSTLHLTKAMGLVASSKIRRALEGMYSGREYENAVRLAIEPLLLCPECAKSPYMRETGNGRTCLVVIAGDRGLAGGYNANVFRALREYTDVDIIPIGKRACDRFKGELRYAESFDYSQAMELARGLCRDFAEGKYDRIGILCTRYVSMMSQEAQVRFVLPLARPEKKKSTGVIFEPDEITILNAAVPEYVAGMLVSAVRESFASEVAARRCAMDSAGKNAQQMIDGLQLEYNRARQGAITQEITEIVAGSGM
ncbi:MAG: ATP synthase F1 subunit gamma [Clostridia bacterium]|nr:ATP synthase F1 subunit gamma [Clostridia bacterium]